jgi:hypothetical protein
VQVLLPRESTSAERAAYLDAGAEPYLLHPLSVEGSSRTAMDRDSK